MTNFVTSNDEPLIKMKDGEVNITLFLTTYIEPEPDLLTYMREVVLDENPDEQHCLDIDIPLLNILDAAIECKCECGGEYKNEMLTASVNAKPYYNKIKEDLLTLVKLLDSIEYCTGNPKLDELAKLELLD